MLSYKRLCEISLLLRLRTTAGLASLLPGTAVKALILLFQNSPYLCNCFHADQRFGHHAPDTKTKHEDSKKPEDHIEEENSVLNAVADLHAGRGAPKSAEGLLFGLTFLLLRLLLMPLSLMLLLWLLIF